VEQPNLELRGKLVVGALMVAILVLSLVLLQQQFDQGDYRRALQMLAQAPGPGWNVGQELVERSGGSTPDCQPRLLSSFAGTLEVSCHAGPGDPYRFEVDLVRRAVQPKNSAAKDLLEAVDRRRQGSSAPDGGLAPDAGE
jgi:hypothetical protein